MDPIFLLKEINLLKGITTALDVGTKNGITASRLVEHGITVDAIDINDLPSNLSKFNFEQVSVTDFLAKNSKKYDLVVARHVLHLLPNSKSVLLALNKISNIFFFTCFGPTDDWFGKVTTLTHDEVMEMFDSKNVRHHSEAFQYGETYVGEMKFWHINTFIIDNRK